MNRTVVAVALSVVVAGIGIGDLWLYRNSSGVDGTGSNGPVTSPDAEVVLPLPERPANAETVGDLIDGLLNDADAHRDQRYASKKRERLVPDGGGTRRWN